MSRKSTEIDIPSSNKTLVTKKDILKEKKITNDEASKVSPKEGLSSKQENPLQGFNSFGFSDNLVETISKKGYLEPTPIQKAAFPELMLGRDLLGQAQTGTGKTAAFALPILERIKTQKGPPQVLVLTPTRELAMQVADSFRAYAEGNPDIKILAIYGGSDFRSQINSLRRGVQIVVGTPGRVMDHMRQGTFVQNQLECLVLDEADEMLRMGFIDDIEWILEQLPQERQMVFFSATMPSEIRRLSKRYLQNPAEITIKAKKQEAKLIRQRYILIQNSYKVEALKRVLETTVDAGVIIFARTKAITLRVAESLEALNHNVAVLNGDVPQNLRERTVERLRQGGVDILVATDVAARGLDVERIGLVINFDMPFDAEAYVHRIGRTGRAGRNGEAILFVSPRERSFINNLERAVGQSIEKMEVPKNEEINKHRINKIKLKLCKSSSNPRKSAEEREILEKLIDQLMEEMEASAKDIALGALNLAIGEAPLYTSEDESWINQTFSNRRYNERRDDRSNRSRRRNNLDSALTEKDKERYRLEVGYRDKVKPGNIVGAIANETGLKGNRIGRIQIFDNYSLVDLPKGMPEEIFKNLKSVKVMNRELKINLHS
ncbi:MULTISPECIES: DEAD/DEAH box helicase [Prochlorococcus]|uniref:DEAD/DEAH box helicase n=1 Tax=Prochlorococcus TaxID=1218 RepID=UPI0005339FE6|nr:MULTISPECIES: DEAD/DEAH box helicase [Prochlorococcus]KGG12263.1 Cold-shock DEAD-box protein A [Prochlorococcus sp. MIT 0601]